MHCHRKSAKKRAEPPATTAACTTALIGEKRESVDTSEACRQTLSLNTPPAPLVMRSPRPRTNTLMRCIYQLEATLRRGGQQVTVVFCLCLKSSLHSPEASLETKMAMSIPTRAVTPFLTLVALSPLVTVRVVPPSLGPPRWNIPSA